MSYNVYASIRFGIIRTVQTSHVLSIHPFILLSSQVLKSMNLSLRDIGVVEFHEAFAGQVLANMTAMASEKVLCCIAVYSTGAIWIELN